MHTSYLDTQNYQMDRVQDGQSGKLSYQIIYIILKSWLARLTVFSYAYFYHDWESVVMIIWLGYSLVAYRFISFSKVTMSIFLVAFIMTFLLYFSLNINGIYQNFFDGH